MDTVRTIFLASDGRHVTLGSGDDVEMCDTALEQVRAQGLRGWVVIMVGDYHGRRSVELSRVHAVEGAAVEDWPTAMEAFMVARAAAGART